MSLHTNRVDHVGSDTGGLAALPPRPLPDKDATTGGPTLTVMANSDGAGHEKMVAALDAAIANAALEGIHLDRDEQDLIRAHQQGAFDRAEFLRRAQALAEAKAEPTRE